MNQVESTLGIDLSHLTLNTSTAADWVAQMLNALAAGEDSARSEVLPFSPPAVTITISELEIDIPDQKKHFMKSKIIRIGRFGINLKGVSSQVARASVRGLGRELMNQLKGHEDLHVERNPSTITAIDAGTSQSPQGTDASGLRRIIAGRVTESISLISTRPHEGVSHPCPI